MDNKRLNLQGQDNCPIYHSQSKVWGILHTYPDPVEGKGSLAFPCDM